jgi:hypothetical protein
MYSAVDSSTAKLSYAFRTEATALLRSEQNDDSLNTVCALNYLSLSSSCAGDEDLSHEYCDQARKMAIRMKLFGVPKDNTVETGGWMANNWKLTTAYCAWGLYNWLTSVSFSPENVFLRFSSLTNTECGHFVSSKRV